MTRGKIAMAGVSAAVALATSVALAATLDCSTGAGARSFNAAYRNHARVLWTLFETRYGCRALAAFSANVNEDARSASVSDACAAEGSRRAAHDTINNASRGCFCVSDGARAGTWRARGYCNPRIGGWWRLQPVCNTETSEHCRAAFDSYVEADDKCREEAANDPNYDKFRDYACASGER